ncbi:MAG: hypothetical protein ACK5XN_09810, partial [Bacteroidota bacterium]
PEVNEKYIDIEWYKIKIQDALRKIILKSKLVDTQSHGRRSIESESGNVFFPHHKNEQIREKLWLLGQNIPTLILPEKDALGYWDDLIWDKHYQLDLPEFSKLLSIWIENSMKDKNLEESFFVFLNEFYALVISEGKIELLDQYLLVPSKNGQFRILNSLKHDKIIDETLLEIISLLIGVDFKDYLLDSRVNPVFILKSFTIGDAAGWINTFLLHNKPVWNEKNTNAVLLLTEWLDLHPELGKVTFPDLYARRAELFMNTISDKESLYQVMRSNIALGKLSEIARTLEEFPGMLSIIEKKKLEIIEEQERNEF